MFKVESGVDPVAAITPVAMQNGWVVQPGRRAAGYRVDRGRVYLSGIVNSQSASAVTAFTLPLEARPSTEIDLPTMYIPTNTSNDTLAVVIVSPDGSVKITSAGNSGTITFDSSMRYINLDGLSFDL